MSLAINSSCQRPVAYGYGMQRPAFKGGTDPVKNSDEGDVAEFSQENEKTEKSTAKKVGVAILSAATLVGIYYLLRGKKLPKNEVNNLADAAENAVNNPKPTPKPAAPKKPVSPKAEPKVTSTTTTSPKSEKPVVELPEQEAVPEAKAAPAPKAETKSPVEPANAHEGAQKTSTTVASTKKADEEMAKRVADGLKSFGEEAKNMTPRELSNQRYEFIWSCRKLQSQALKRGHSTEYEILKSLTPENREKYQLLKGKLEIIEAKIAENTQRLSAFRPTVCKGSAIPLHHEVNGQNTFIRRDLATKRGAMTDVIADIDAQFAKLPPTEKEYIVYRGRTEHPISAESNKDFEMLEHIKVGDKIVPDTGYSYTAFDRSTADYWGGIGAGGTNLEGENLKQVMYTIHIPKGAKVSRNLEHSGEVLMPRGAEYKVLGKHIEKDGALEVELEYILPQNK